jgi:hypothetical protein
MAIISASVTARILIFYLILILIFFIMDINYPFIDMPTLRKQGIEKSLNITSVIISKNLENCIYVPPSRNVLFLKLLY